MPVTLPGSNVYVLAPFGVIVTLLPLQIALLLILAKPIVGVALTVIVLVKFVAEEPEQPLALLPLIVYTVVLIGFTTKLVPVILPGCSV